MSFAAFVIDRTNPFEWFTKCSTLIYCLLLFPVTGNGNMSKSQSLGVLVLKTGLRFDLKVVNWLGIQVQQRLRSWLLTISGHQ